MQLMIRSMNFSDKLLTALVIGQGSAGQRHARVLAEIGLTVTTVSRRANVGLFTSIAKAVEISNPDYVVVATETIDHARVLADLSSVASHAKILVEKPLFGACPDTSLSAFRELRVGFSLRMHSGLRKLRAEIADQTVVSAQIYCGQYLPDWRPDRDYRDTYSSDRARGGGALHDLSHELDYAGWLFGAYTRVSAIGGSFGSLGIKADDSWGILASFERCPIATLQMNYLFRPLRRDCVVVTTEHSYELDFRTHTLSRDGECIDRDSVAMDALTRRLHNSFLDDVTDLPGASEAAQVDNLIWRIEQAGQSQ
jgi:predicted dehydrogenase